MIIYNIDYSKNEKQLDKFQFVEWVTAALNGVLRLSFVQLVAGCRLPGAYASDGSSKSRGYSRGARFSSMVAHWPWFRLR